MSEPRFISVTREQAELCESFGQVMLAQGDPDGTKLLSLYLAWKYANRPTIDIPDPESLDAARMVEALESERVRLRVIEGGAA